MTVPIVLYDENHERMGETYHRRAKQLVRSGRAVWLEEGHSLQMIPCQATEIPALPHIKEDIVMIESMHNNNGIPPAAPEALHPYPTDTGHNELRMYLARQNVARRKNLIRNIIAYVLVWVILVFPITFMPVGHRSDSFDFTVGSNATGGIRRQSRNTSIDEIRNYEMRPSISEHPFTEYFIDSWLFPFRHDLQAYIIENVNESLWDAFGGRGVIWTAEPHINTVQFSNAPPHVGATVSVGTTRNNNFMPFVAGIMVAWGIWILSQGIKVSRQNMRTRPVRAAKPDPVALEYQRLSNTNDYV